MDSCWSSNARSLAWKRFMRSDRQTRGAPHGVGMRHTCSGRPLHAAASKFCTGAVYARRRWIGIFANTLHKVPRQRRRPTTAIQGGPPHSCPARPTCDCRDTVSARALAVARPLGGAVNCTLAKFQREYCSHSGDIPRLPRLAYHRLTDTSVSHVPRFLTATTA